jgi:hypothetical protein
VPLASECTTPDSRLGDSSPGTDVRGFKTYPFALVLRLRVLQVGKISEIRRCETLANYVMYKFCSRSQVCPKLFATTCRTK